MAYPSAVHAGNLVIEAAVACAHARIPGTSSVPMPEMARLLVTVEAYEAATARPHEQGPDIDADTTVTIRNADGSIVRTLAL